MKVTSFRKNRIVGKMKFYVFCFFTLSLGCQCQNASSDSQDPLNNEELEKKAYSLNIVLCDLTSSDINENIDSVASRASQIIRNIPQPAEIIFLTIEDNLFISPLHTYIKEKKRPKKPSEREKLLSEYTNSIESNAQRVSSKIISKFQNIQQELKERDPARSCILNYVKRAEDIFYQKTKDSSMNYTTRLFILSDMVELCNDSELGAKIRFTPKNLERVQNTIDDYNPEFSLEGLDELYIIPFTNEDFSKSESLSSSKIIDLWTTLLGKLKYSRADRLYFEPQVPRF